MCEPMKISATSMIILATVLLTTSGTAAYAYGYGYHHGYSDHYGHGYHNGVSVHGHGEVALGLLAGVLISYALLNHHDYRTHPPRQHRTTPIYRPPPQAAASCAQQREYHTTIVIDGEELPAWGIACRQPDGSWQRKGLSLTP